MKAVLERKIDAIRLYLTHLFRRSNRLRFLAAVVGPIACWLPLLFYLFTPYLNSDIWQQSIPPSLKSYVNALVILMWLTYLPLSSAICGFSASYFLREECAAIPANTKIKIGFWTHFLFVLPLFFHPCSCLCLAGFAIPLHIWIFNIAFSRGVKFWQSERPKQWIGDYEQLPESEEPKP
jgi:hypothetical protein